MKEPLIKVKNLSKFFTLKRNRTLKAVDDVSIDIYPNETLGIVGESGCGKTTLGRTILGLYEATSGSVWFDGLNVHKADRKEMKSFKKRAQIILQDPYASLNPRMTVGDIIAEGINVQKLYYGQEKTEKIYELLDLVGLNKEHASRFPHEFSGGQRQRIGIARTLAVNPEFIVCDEPISALDVSIQSQIVKLLMKLQKELGLTFLFIAHDLSMVQYISNRVGVMYLGNLVELASSAKLYKDPKHPYTKALLSAIPSIDLENPMSSRRIKMDGEIPSPINPKDGCRFASRCPNVKSICECTTPKLKEIEKDHYVACHIV
ncbi:oligopeptide ABC transporter ATP-binding protein OppF [Natranaerobius trueperi]|uniref:Oligopeptide ABC transporter ATP-binding protein OppF n=2 Tax=Natranaerobius trueperi TaxID=759412 RepID=A0A226BXH7_9FIRM|nr:ABC transporter ATP-binding protein [Natranaerobius trueperi]OWZ83696.1 oligopeptide ABC transporter ATP-binding protein OppF [Natranaerobius trueperi]